MGILDFFRPIQAIPPPEVRRLIAEQRPDSYNLVDVRKLSEYQKGHLPGAVLIPLDELEGSLGKLDPAKPTVVY